MASLFRLRCLLRRAGDAVKLLRAWLAERRLKREWNEEFLMTYHHVSAVEEWRRRHSSIDGNPNLAALLNLANSRQLPPLP